MICRLHNVFRSFCVRGQPLLGACRLQPREGIASSAASINEVQSESSGQNRQTSNTHITELLKRVSALHLHPDVLQRSQHITQQRTLTTCSRNFPHNNEMTNSQNASSLTLTLLKTSESSTSQTMQRRSAHAIKMRRWHMNRHRYLRVKKKNRSKLLKQKYLTIRRRVDRYREALTVIREDGENFDALQFVKSRIERAKRGGFVQDIWRSADEQPSTPWESYSVPDLKKCKTYEPSRPVPSTRHPKKLRAELKLSKKVKARPRAVFDFLQ